MTLMTHAVLKRVGKGFGEFIVWSARSFIIHLFQRDPSTNGVRKYACPFGIQKSLLVKVWYRVVAMG